VANASPTPLRIDDELTRRKHADALRALIQGEVRFEKHDRMLYATDASLYQMEPIGVVVPADYDDLRRVVEYCRDHRLPMLPRGGGTSLAGQCTNHAVVIDVSPTINELEWVGEETRACVVQPGLTIDDLNDQLREHGLFFAPDPATARQCNIGGAIGNNAAGTRSIRYGRTSESIEAVTLLLATGEEVNLGVGSCSDILWRDLNIPEEAKRRCARQTAIARHLGEGVIDICRRHAPLIRERFPKTTRRNAGYALDMTLDDIEAAERDGVDPLERINLAHLVCGSEGTLGIVTGATLKLHPLPAAKGLAVVGFASLEEAIDAVVPLLELKPSAVELLDDMVIGLAKENIEYREYVALMPQPQAGPLSAVLYVEFFADSGDDEIEERFDQVERVVGARFPTATVARYTNPGAVAQALKLRKAGEPLLHAIPGKRKPLGFVEDNAVPVEHLAEFVRGFKRIMASKGTTAAFYAHASVGVLHVRPLLNLRDAGDRKAMEEIAVEVAHLAKSLGGVMSGEHGDGRSRGPLLERHFGPELMQAFREVKQLFDPHNLMNPGNIVPLGEHPLPIESIHETTRIRPTGFDLDTEPIDTFFDFARDGGFDHAVELCNGAGVCRKKQGGTMCPSYMGTLDERHSTRGRGNALRLAITGQLERGTGPNWNDAGTLETLDLCLSCKGCKTECPSNVDIAQYKAEYLAQSYKASRRVPLKARFFGHVRALNRLGSALAPFSNWGAAFPPFRAVANAVLGLHPRRSLPRFERSLLRQAKAEFCESKWIHSGLFRALVIEPESDTVPTVLLYADCFTSYNEPHIGLSTIRVLRAFGYRVVVPTVECCGRSLVSVGLLEEARGSSMTAACQLGELGSQFDAKAVVVCEPSCLSAIKDEWLALKRIRVGEDSIPTREILEHLAMRSFLPEDFLNLHWDDHPKRPSFNKPEGLIALHAHCHQKALWGAETSARLLRRIAGDAVRGLDTGCCGMAGSFGFDKRRFDLSMKIGELALFPAVRQLGPGDVLVAPGTSCRHQAHDGTGRTALHPIELVDRLLAR